MANANILCYMTITLSLYSFVVSIDFYFMYLFGYLSTGEERTKTFNIQAVVYQTGINRKARQTLGIQTGLGQTSRSSGTGLGLQAPRIKYIYFSCHIYIQQHTSNTHTLGNGLSALYTNIPLLRKCWSLRYESLFDNTVTPHPALAGLKSYIRPSISKGMF